MRDVTLVILNSLRIKCHIRRPLMPMMSGRCAAAIRRYCFSATTCTLVCNKSRIKRPVKSSMRMLANLYTTFRQQDPPYSNNPPSSLDMLERSNFPALEQAIHIYAGSGEALKAGLKGSLYYLLKKKADFIIKHEDDKAAEVDKFVVVLEMYQSPFCRCDLQGQLKQADKAQAPTELAS